MPDETTQLIRTLFDTTREPLPAARQAELLGTIRAMSGDAGKRADMLVCEHITRLRRGLKEARGVQEELKGLIETLTAPPWYLATYRGPMTTADGERAVIQVGKTRTAVGLVAGGVHD